ncbi:Protein S100-A11 Calgizzarin Protein S100-C S100 calcium-binding protein A11 [Channa argus]|uniref:Protein S100-A11 Calgizzarin Protein S100-C S100 calcium-binding protein A11 n=2 Tax=Channa argus TaxID=215402 RepID=A0A6G1QXX0_CHAAH|nr:Protein S100-A11 Calgizzarin Protein S100-C S100 calcium-binding protein A11 [Channa argus]
MEAAICTLVNEFKVYAGKDGSSSTLSKDEFHNLVTSQLPNYVKNANDPGVIDRLMGSLDKNNDGELTFTEFWELLGKLACKQGGFKRRVMEAAIQTMVKVYLKSSKGKENLGNKEFHNLVKTQLSNILSDTDSKEAVKKMGQGLDSNQDGKVGFEEYLKLVGYLAVSLSEQRNLGGEEPAQNSASGQVAQNTHNNEENKPEATAEAKEEAKPEANEGVKAASTAEVKVEVKTDGKVEDVKAEVGAQPQAAAAVEVVVKDEKKVEITEHMEDAAEKLAAAVDANVEKKTEEGTS